MKQSAGGMNKGVPVKKSRPIVMRKHLSAEDVAALANMNAKADQSYTRISGNGVVSGGSLGMCHNNDHR